ncbi:FAS1-like dehydratase domain-containing protein [Geminicoccus roseus]|uniref:FAS1-like dehydratase domain-containing protein n=1 Tax=Geminicoccus roseus TaxID=404900 RepID=UPI000424B457|nr:MaoC family dehydratase N-terminal domain-containing protein [Geminicoccus roseus]
MSDSVDIQKLQAWIGRTEQAEDWISPQMVKALRATLDQEPGQPVPGEPAPLAIHWCLAPPAVAMSGLGPDGHPARGGFLPPVPLPRRMWAGGALHLHDRLCVGDKVERVSRIEAVELKEGRTGRLCFVTVRHEFATGRGVAIAERQDIVYREAQAPAPAQPAAERPPQPSVSRAIQATPTLLFRYSALTFNGHRIHYDRRYCQEEEGYPGLVVHGPLQATLLLDLAAGMRGGTPPETFRFRGIYPLFDGGSFTINGRDNAGRLDLWVADQSGRRTMIAGTDPD